jgi:ATP-dependent DNA helicase RecQ
MSAVLPAPAAPVADSTPQQVLHEVFGYAAFRGQQAAVVEHATAGGDALVLMPTGAGKSLCYQVPSLVRAGTGVVVSPLIALMQDQVDALRENGVRAEYLNSTLSMEDARRVERAMRAGEIDLLYVAPERLLTDRCLELLEQSRIALFAIDEAHCVSQWGHDFRPEYLGLSVLHERFPSVPRVALTATADPQTRREIRERLALDDVREFVSSFDRPNIRYTIVEKDEPRRQLLALLSGELRGQAGDEVVVAARCLGGPAEFGHLGPQFGGIGRILPPQLAQHIAAISPAPANCSRGHAASVARTSPRCAWRWTSRCAKAGITRQSRRRDE